jgi:acetoacetyl-CoA reductase
MSRVALVTGGTGGLGTSICRHLAQAGMQVVANYLPGLEAQAETWQSTLARDGVHCDIIAADVADAAACQQMADSLLVQHGVICILINNAGITRDATLRKLEPVDWQAVIDTNLSSLYNVTRPLLDAMLGEGYGRIVNISSVNAQRGQFGQTSYSAAKAGVHGFTKALAQETASKGITVNTVSPGFIATDMVQAIPEHLRQAIVDSIPVGRVGLPDDIARAVAFLTDENAGYITGTELSVNGGLFMH